MGQKGTQIEREIAWLSFCFTIYLAEIPSIKYKKGGKRRKKADVF
jgi:hypothetical protein